MRKVTRMIAVELVVDDAITDTEVDADLEKALTGEHARSLLQEPSPTRYWTCSWRLESAQLADVVPAAVDLAGAWEKTAAKCDQDAAAGRRLGKAELAVQRAEAAYWLRHCTGQLRAVLGGTLRVKRRVEGGSPG